MKTNTINVISERENTLFENAAARKGKESVRAFFDTYKTQLSAQWDGLKKAENAFSALNAVISGIAGGEGLQPAVWLIEHFSRYIDADGRPCRKQKDENGNYYFTSAALTGVTARGLLKAAALNCIESNRKGNRFSQTVVTPEAVRKPSIDPAAAALIAAKERIAALEAQLKEIARPE